MIFLFTLEVITHCMLWFWPGKTINTFIATVRLLFTLLNWKHKSHTLDAQTAFMRQVNHMWHDFVFLETSLSGVNVVRQYKMKRGHGCMVCVELGLASGWWCAERRLSFLDTLIYTTSGFRTISNRATHGKGSCQKQLGFESQYKRKLHNKSLIFCW